MRTGDPGDVDRGPPPGFGRGRGGDGQHRGAVDLQNEGIVAAAVEVAELQALGRGVGNAEVEFQARPGFDRGVFGGRPDGAASAGRDLAADAAPGAAVGVGFDRPPAEHGVAGFGRRVADIHVVVRVDGRRGGDREVDPVVAHGPGPGAAAGAGLVEALLGQHQPAIVDAVRQHEFARAGTGRFPCGVDAHIGRADIGGVGRIGRRTDDRPPAERSVAHAGRSLAVGGQDVEAGVEREVDLGVAEAVGDEVIEQQVALVDVGGVILVGLVVGVGRVRRRGLGAPPSSRVADVLVGLVIAVFIPDAGRFADELHLVGEIGLQVRGREVAGEGRARAAGVGQTDIGLVVGVGGLVGGFEDVVRDIPPAVVGGRPGRGVAVAGQLDGRRPGRRRGRGQHGDDQDQERDRASSVMGSMHNVLLARFGEQGGRNPFISAGSPCGRPRRPRRCGSGTRRLRSERSGPGRRCRSILRIGRRTRARRTRAIRRAARGCRGRSRRPFLRELRRS